MPTYDYRCNACEHEFELFQSMKDAPKRKCPECGKNALERLIGLGAGIIFKGSGFYETDYRSESYKKGAKADSGESGGGDKPEKSDKKDKKKDSGGKSNASASAGCGTGCACAAKAASSN